MKDALSNIRLDFSEESLLFLNLSLAFIMFGVALGIDTKNFRELLKNPKSVVTGVFSQFLLLPALTFLLVWFFKPIQGLALGMILVAACPGGNLSNFFSSVSKGNVALSITLTAIATILATFMTPINFEFWSNLYLGDKLTIEVKMEAFKMVKMVFFLLVVPLLAGLGFSHKFPEATIKISKPIKIISFIILIGFIVIAFLKNFDLFTQYYQYILILVFLHNLIALASGYWLSKLVGNASQDNRTISIETGIQNSGLGLVIVFTLFDGNGGMALITAWWGIWHIISGIFISFVYSKGEIFTLQTND